MTLSNVHPKFLQWLTDVAVANGKTTKQIYDLWRGYSRDCQSFDQSPVQSEFLRWHKFKEGQFHGTTCCTVKAHQYVRESECRFGCADCGLPEANEIHR